MTFDIKKGRALAEKAREYKIYTPPGATGYGVDHSKYPDFIAMKEISQIAFPAACDEIERLRAENANWQQEHEANHADSVKQITRIKELTADFAQSQVERDHQAKHIEVLQAALITERAKSKTGHVFWPQTPLEIRKMFLKKAEEELHAEGIL